jgi:hypothetical protein
VLSSITTSSTTQTCAQNPASCEKLVLDSQVDYDSPVTCSPGLASAKFELRVQVNGTRASECADCAAGQYQLPAGSRTVVSLVAVDVPGLQPRQADEPEETYLDRDVLYRTGSSGAGSCPGAADCATMEITGSVKTRSGCTKFTQVWDDVYCTEHRTYLSVRALTEVHAAFDELSLDVDSVALEAGGAATPPTGYGAPRTVSGAAWATSAGAKVPDA